MDHSIYTKAHAKPPAILAAGRRSQLPFKASECRGCPNLIPIRRNYPRAAAEPATTTNN
jgi:hypothetical protein